MDYDDYVTHMEIKLETEKMDSIPHTGAEKLLGIGTVREIEQEIMAFSMDLATMAFYTDFLFTKESKLFRYSLMREPDGERPTVHGYTVRANR